MEIELHDMMLLRGKNRIGRDIIEQHGDIWQVIGFDGGVNICSHQDNEVITLLDGERRFDILDIVGVEQAS